MKLYTGAGDKGMTSLFSGERIEKSDLRVAANGDLDELNSFLGALAAILAAEHPALVEEIQHVQAHLLSIGAWVATTPDSPSAAFLEVLDDGPTRTLESAIDKMEEDLPVLRGFILPGGSIPAAWAHLARTVCRRAERQVVGLLERPDESGPAEPLLPALSYLNRLSDYLFVLARFCNHFNGSPDISWKD